MTRSASESWHLRIRAAVGALKIDRLEGQRYEGPTLGRPGPLICARSLVNVKNVRFVPISRSPNLIHLPQRPAKVGEVACIQNLDARIVFAVKGSDRTRAPSCYCVRR